MGSPLVISSFSKKPACEKSQMDGVQEACAPAGRPHVIVQSEIAVFEHYRTHLPDYLWPSVEIELHKIDTMPFSQLRTLRNALVHLTNADGKSVLAEMVRTCFERPRCHSATVKPEIVERTIAAGTSDALSSATAISGLIYTHILRRYQELERLEELARLERQIADLSTANSEAARPASGLNDFTVHLGWWNDDSFIRSLNDLGGKTFFRVRTMTDLLLLHETQRLIGSSFFRSVSVRFSQAFYRRLQANGHSRLLGKTVVRSLLSKYLRAALSPRQLLRVNITKSNANGSPDFPSLICGFVKTSVVAVLRPLSSLERKYPCWTRIETISPSPI